MKGAGLTGIEVYYQDYLPEEMDIFGRLAEKFGLLPLGGSDYHGLGGPKQREPGMIPLPIEPVNALFKLAEERGSLSNARIAHH